MKRWMAAGLLALVATACTTTAPRQGSDATLLAAQAAREAALAGQANWTMAGRLSVSADGEGGNGRIEWRQRGGDFEIRLSAPVTRKSWRLLSVDGQVALEGLEGGTRAGADAETLLMEATGWRIPLAALGAWARGARASGPATVEFTPEGLPALIVQQGWQVEYREWDAADPARPRRVFARQGESTVRLVVDTWGEP
ncbi:MAG: outer membrane lipoprotein LolB [Lysobacteraceae bacterium]|nr:MAG: outer membrane lipoprotein LolB [Xanthomonadaceae bacterium]